MKVALLSIRFKSCFFFFVLFVRFQDALIFYVFKLFYLSFFCVCVYVCWLILFLFLLNFGNKMNYAILRSGCCNVSSIQRNCHDALFENLRTLSCSRLLLALLRNGIFVIFPEFLLTAVCFSLESTQMLVFHA